MKLRRLKTNLWKTISRGAVLFSLLLAGQLLRGAPVVDTVVKLVPSDISPNLFFGNSVAIENGIAAVGAPDVDSGAVYTYALVAGTWVQTQKLTQPTPACGTNLFGISLAMHDGLLVVGQPTGCPEVGPGQVFVYRLVAGTWILQQQIQPVPGFPVSGFGASVALDGNTIAVGYPNDPNGPGGGSVSIYTNSGSFFFFQAKVTAPPNTFQAGTGTSVAVEGDTLVAGAPGATIAGSAYVYTRSGTTWTLTSTLHPAFSTGADFGTSAALQGGTLVVGAPNDADTNGIFGGAAYVFFPTIQKLTPTDNVRGLGFGTSVSVLNSTVVVGIPFRTVSGKTNAGAVDIFVLNGTNWTLAQEIVASDPTTGAQFGNAVDIGASGIIVGAPFDSQVVTNGGAAYIFSSSASNGPVIVSISASPNRLFPPNHKLIPVTITVNATGTGVTSRITSVTSNQPINGTGDGNTSPDWIITGNLTVLLRAERAGNIKTDRVYTITVTSTDVFGNSTTKTVQVVVPHDQGK